MAPSTARVEGDHCCARARSWFLVPSLVENLLLVVVTKPSCHQHEEQGAQPEHRTGNTTGNGSAGRPLTTVELQRPDKRHSADEIHTEDGTDRYPENL